MRITRKQANTLAALMPGDCYLGLSCADVLWVLPERDDSIRSGISMIDIRPNGDGTMIMRDTGRHKSFTYEQVREQTRGAILESEAMQDA